MITKLPESNENLLAIEVSGKNTGEDDRQFRPIIDELIKEYGTVKFLIILKVKVHLPQRLLRRTVCKLLLPMSAVSAISQTICLRCSKKLLMSFGST